MILTKEQIDEMIKNVQGLLMINKYKAKNPDELVKMTVMHTLDELNFEYEDDCFEVLDE